MYYGRKNAMLSFQQMFSFPLSALCGHKLKSLQANIFIGKIDEFKLYFYHWF